MSPRKLALVGAVVALAAAACSSSKIAASTPPTTMTVGPASTAAPAAAASGQVDVLYAGSLVTLMEHHIGPGFHSATGAVFTGVSGDSGSLANQIKGRTQRADVFISASPAKDQLLEGAANGNWVTWYATFATSGLVLGYNPHSRFASELQSRPWYTVITQPGFLLGRTDPATDPKGKLTVTALDDASAGHGAATSGITASSSNVFAENTLVGRLQAGQLDAGFFYAVEASTAGIPTVPLTGIENLAARYTVTVLTGAPHPAGAAAFVGYLLGPDGSGVLAGHGLTPVRPADLSGTPPASLRAVLPAG